jgi:hypothetical protein
VIVEPGKKRARHNEHRWPGKRNMNMEKLPEHAAQHKKNPTNTTFWSGECQLNRRESLKLTLSECRGQQTADVRRWLQPGGGKPAQSTKRGVTFLVEYLPDLRALVDEALHQAQAQGLLPAGGRR